MSTKQRQSRTHRRREAALRATRCKAVAISRGYRHTTPLIDILAEYAAYSDVLPFPAQKTIAKKAGCCERTVRYWLTVLEALDLVHVTRSTARPTGTAGEWTRQTNRYLLCDLKAERQPETWPLKRRRRTAENQQISPSGNRLPQTPRGLEPGRAERSALGPDQAFRTQIAPTNVSASAPPMAPLEDLVAVVTKTDPKTTLEGLSAARVALRQARERS